MVSSQVTHAPHGMEPPEQFIIVPARLAQDAAMPSPSTTTDVVPPPARESYAGAVAENGAGAGSLISWLRMSTELPVGAGEGGHAVVPPGDPGPVGQDPVGWVGGVVEGAV